MKKLILSGILAGAAATAAAGLSDLRGEYRNGQVFLQWRETGLPADARLSVWSSAAPITAATLDRATEVASLLNVNSARDWWLDRANFVIDRSKKAKSEEIFAGNVADVDKSKQGLIRGFVISDGGAPIAPEGGLHVHTPKAGQTGSRYYAVGRVKNGKVLEFTATAAPLEVGPGQVNAIRIAGNITREQTAGKPMIVSLHGRGGGVGVDSRGNPVGTHILFTDSTLAWREGIPYKFTVSVNRQFVQITLCDRTWAGRSLTRAESPDSRDYVPAIASFWLGYNTNLGVSNRGPKFTWDNYSERVILKIVDWMIRAMGVDADRVYLYGGSMGGTGSVQMATHYPEVFAAAYAMVPVYAYTWKPTPTIPRLAPSITRMQCSIGRFKPTDQVLSPDGKDLLEYGDGARNINRPGVDMPPIFATNGRQDMSIPWVNNPPFYKAANEARQAFSVMWNNGGHGMTREVPAVVNYPSGLLRYRRDQAFPAFSNCSDNRDYGDGDPTKGDLVGWINRGLNWKNIKDTPRRFEITLTAAFPEQTVKGTVYPAMKYPVTCDVTFRRRRQFKFAPGTKIAVSVNGELRETVIDKDGLLTVEKVVFKDAAPLKIVCTAK